jgi:hypothetical protein
MKQFIEDNKLKIAQFWRRNQIIIVHFPLMVAFLIGSYIVLNAWDSRIGVEGFGDVFGYALNGLRAVFILFTAWWMKKNMMFDLYAGTELELFNLAKDGNRNAHIIRFLDRLEWALALAFATYWYTR